MKIKKHIVGSLVAATWLMLAATSQAQIASYVDEHGKRVYVNEESPVSHHKDALNAHPVKSAAVPPAVVSPVAKPRIIAQVTPGDRLDRIVSAAAERHKIDPALVKAVISTESGWNPGAVSRKGAVGLMQLIPGTAQRFGVGNPYDPAQNVEGGTTYLKWLLNRYDGDLTKSLAAYNAGEHAVDLSGGVPAYRETQLYVEKVTNAYFRPGSGRTSTLWSPKKPPMRRDVDSGGRVIFTNE